MANEEKKEASSINKDKEISVAEMAPQEIKKQLDKFDGYDELITPLAKNLNSFSPGSDSKKKRFLKDDDLSEERSELRDRLKAFVDLLSKENASDSKKIRNAAQQKLDSNEELMNSNLEAILKAARPLEQTYSELELFFRNAAPQKVKNLTLINVHPEVLIDHTSNALYNLIDKRITDQSRSVDQKKAFSLLVIPNLWKSKQPKLLIERYTKLAGISRLTFLTDFADCESLKDVLEEREKKSWQGVVGSEAHHSHLVLFANHLMLRGKHEELNEQSDMHGSPAMAVAGKMYSEKISQPIMGEMNGSVSGAQGIVFHTVQDEVADLSDVGLNGMMHAYEKDMAYEQCTAFDGAEYALKRYAVVRTFDYVNRVLRHYLGKVTGQQLDRARANFVRDTIVDFLKQLAEQKIITSGTVTQFDWNDRVPDRIDIDISIVPLWAVRTFVYALKAAKGESASSELKETK